MILCIYLHDSGNKIIYIVSQSLQWNERCHQKKEIDRVFWLSGNKWRHRKIRYSKQMVFYTFISVNEYLHESEMNKNGVFIFF